MLFKCLEFDSKPIWSPSNYFATMTTRDKRNFTLIYKHLDIKYVNALFQQAVFSPQSNIRKTLFLDMKYIVYPNRGFFTISCTFYRLSKMMRYHNLDQKVKFDFQAKDNLCFSKKCTDFSWNQRYDPNILLFEFWFTWCWSITDCRLLNAFYVKRKLIIDIKLFIVWKTNQTTVINFKFDFIAFLGF